MSRIKSYFFYLLVLLLSHIFISVYVVYLKIIILTNHFNEKFIFQILLQD